MKLSYLIGVDGGGTGTRARVTTPDGRTLGIGQAGPSALGQGVQQAWRHVQQALEAAFGQAGLRGVAPQACAMGLGLSGAHLSSRREAFLASAPDFAHVLLSDDGSAALYGAHAGRPGAIMAVGTGSIGEALWADGRRVTVGGWGFGVGDEGSGAWLGLKAMALAHKAHDGRLRAGPLVEQLWALAGRSREQLLAWSERAGQAQHAQLAPLIFEFERQDPACTALIAEAVAEIQLHLHALDPGVRLPLVLTGSIGLRLRPRFPQAVQARCVEPAGDATEGALRLLQRDLRERGL